jgi:hypothetical protein
LLKHVNFAEIIDGAFYMVLSVVTTTFVNKQNLTRRANKNSPPINFTFRMETLRPAKRGRRDDVHVWRSVWFFFNSFPRKKYISLKLDEQQ